MANFMISVSLLMLPACARIFPSDPANPGLGLIRVAGHFEIRLPRCARGVKQTVLVSSSDPDTTKNVSATQVQTVWEVSRPWPVGDQTVVLGETTSSMDIIHSYVGVPDFSNIEIDVSSEKQTWIGIFDLRKVGASLSAGIGEPQPISQEKLDQIGNC